MSFLRTAEKSFDRAMKIVRMYQKHEKQGKIKIHSLEVRGGVSQCSAIKTGKNRGKSVDITPYSVTIEFD